MVSSVKSFDKVASNLYPNYVSPKNVFYGSMQDKQSGIQSSSAVDKLDIARSISKGTQGFNAPFMQQFMHEMTTGNKLLSPLGAYFLLSTIYPGIKDEPTQQQVENVLGINSLREKGMHPHQIFESIQGIAGYLMQMAKNTGVTLNIADSIWAPEEPSKDSQQLSGQEILGSSDSAIIQSTQADSIQNTEPWAPAYHRLMEANGVGIGTFQNEDPTPINGWVSSKTNGLIPEVLTRQELQDVVAVLINAIYFKGDWSSKFNPQVFQGTFHGINGPKKVGMMFQEQKPFRFVQLNNLKAITLPYGPEREDGERDNNLNMTVIVPEKGQISGVYKQLSASRTQDPQQPNLGSVDIHLSHR